MSTNTLISERKTDTGNLKIEINAQFKQALELMEKTHKNIFITGKAGTGKSTLLDYFRNNTRKEVAVLAPTGVAAVNVRGQTIHSFFRFKPDIIPSKVKKFKKVKERELYQKIDAIIIDEISMARADLLDCVDRFLRLNGNDPYAPFGGVQMIFIGDLYQLPPVVTGKEREIFRTQYESPYFFSAKVFAGDLDMEFIELEKVYRQKDTHFIQLLNTIRNNTASEGDLEALNRRYRPDFQPEKGEQYIYLTAINAKAKELNDLQLTKLKGKLFKYQGRIKGDFNLNHIPTDMELYLKVGAQVMLLNNDSDGRWVNGTIGKIVEIVQADEPDDDDIIYVRITNGMEVAITPYRWDIFNFMWDEEKNILASEVMGSFTQYPLRLAWAITIHKSQGKTFDNVIIDLERGTFAPGQLYVALSRCTRLDGMVLKQPLKKGHILMDWRVVQFVTSYQYAISEKNCPLDHKEEIIRQAIREKRKLDIVYLKASDEKSRRTIEPESLGKMTYQGKQFLGVSAFDSKRGETRTFRIDRILEMKEL